jgi:hypothetical protein
MVKRYYEKTWFIILAVIFFFPIGLYLYYKYHTASYKTKLIVNSMVFLMFFIVPPLNIFKFLFLLLPSLILAVLSYKNMRTERFQKYDSSVDSELAITVEHNEQLPIVTDNTIEEKQNTENHSFFGKIKSVYNENKMALEGMKLYKEMFKEFLSDDALSLEEKNKLSEVINKYNLTEKELKHTGKDICNNYIKKISTDKRISQKQFDTLKEIIVFTNADLKQLNLINIDTYHELWKLEQDGALPILDWSEINIIPKNDEVLHFVGCADLQKIKKVSSGTINYGGFTSSFRICKGVNYRVGSIKAGRETHEELTTIDDGNFFITSQRVGFIGVQKSFTIQFNKILSFDVDNEYGLIIRKEGAVNPQMLSMYDYDLPCIILSKIVNE